MTDGAKDIQGLAARRAALRLLDAVLRRGETLDQAAVSATAGLLTSSDAAFARAIAGEALRWLADLDALIDSATRQRLADDAKARTVLRIMLVQWLRLETPPHAVVATALPLLTGGPRRLAHGVFGTLVRQGLKLPEAPTLPVSTAERWGERGPAIAAGLAEPPPLDLALRDPAMTDEWCERLGGTSLAPGHVRLARGDQVSALAGFDEGAWWVQDLAASLPGRLLGRGNGRRVLDLCAAPGGKTLQLAAAGWQVTALDISKRRLELLHQNLARTGQAAEVIVADALAWTPAEPFDAILLDAPCTATGTVRRHPDVLWRKDVSDVLAQSDLQRRLLAAAAEMVKPGGTLLYCVCSLSREEGEDVTAAFLESHRDFERAPIAPAELAGEAQFLTPMGDMRTLPSHWAEIGGLDGFYACRLRRTR
jgi:16S rRNA (cytosine967-C5)-methyltransferase